MSMSNKDYFNGVSLTWWFVQQLDVYTDYPELCFILIALFPFVDQTSALFLAAKIYHLLQFKGLMPIVGDQDPVAAWYENSFWTSIGGFFTAIVQVVFILQQ